MMIYRAVVSWLAFLFLVYRGIFLTGVFVLDERGFKSYPGPAPPFLGYAGQVSLYESLKWSFLWSWLAFMIVFPWLRMILAQIAKIKYGQASWESHSFWTNVVGRWTGALVLVTSMAHDWPRGVLGFLTVTPYSQEDWFSLPFPSLLLDAMLAIAAAMLAAPELSVLASSGFTGFIDAVFFPGGRETRPPYTVKLARWYVETQRWEEAEAEYARMLSFHPDQAEAWRERLTLAFRRLDTADPAPGEVLTMAIKALQVPAEREALHQCFILKTAMNLNRRA